jgi:hypothetical protein
MKKSARAGDEKPAHTQGPKDEFSKLERQYDRASIEERDRLHPDFIRAIRKKLPGLVEETWRALRNGDGLKVTLRHAMKRVLDRNDLSMGRKTNAREDADAAMWLIDELQREHLKPKKMRGHGYELATRTLFVGLRAGLSLAEAEELRAKHLTEHQRKAGAKSGESRRDKLWREFAKNETVRMRKANRTLTPTDIAKKIENNWSTM